MESIAFSAKFFLKHKNEFKSPFKFYFYLLIRNATEFNLYETGKEIGLSRKCTYVSYSKIKKLGLVTEIRRTNTEITICFNKSCLGV